MNVHRAHFGDELLQRALDDSRPHPFVEHGRWPLTSHHAVVELLTRACALTVLSTEAGAALASSMTSGDTNRKISSELYVLDVAGLAARDAWAVEVAPVLPSGRRPDLRLTREDAELWIEGSSAGPDVARRSVEAWNHAVVQALIAIGSRRCVETSGDATSIELEATSWVGTQPGAVLRSCGPHGIMVNAVCSAQSTPMPWVVCSAETIAETTANVPLRRIGQPADIVSSGLFLASANCSYVTCQILSPNGGMWTC